MTAHRDKTPEMYLSTQMNQVSSLRRHLAMGLLALVLVLSGCEQGRLDMQVRELCAKDGGLKIYETVKLPRSKFDDKGHVNFFHPSNGELALGPEYIWVREQVYLKKGNPSMSRIHQKVIRRSDGKLLGESIRYSRSGGDVPGPWEESAFACPEIGAHAGVLSLFVWE